MINFKGTNRQLLNLYRGLENVKEIRGSRFAVLVGKNMKEIKQILQPIEEAAVPSASQPSSQRSLERHSTGRKAPRSAAPAPGRGTRLGAQASLSAPNSSQFVKFTTLPTLLQGLVAIPQH